MKNTKRVVSVVLAFLLVFTVISPVLVYADSLTTASAYQITNPYADINWQTVHSYKSALHTHTNASDGDPTLFESVQRHLECGFDAVATTDHGTVNYTWETANPNKLIYGALSAVGKSEGDLVYLGKSGTFSNGTAYEYTTENGNDYVKTATKTIMRIPYGIENNAVSVNAHVNGWFADYHNNAVTTYVDAVRGVDKAGGVSVINHPGEYTKARYEIHSEDAYNTNEYSYWYMVNKFASLLEKYDSCIGVDVNSKGDSRTRFDRILWDTLLERFANNGENVYAIASSDAHQLNKIDTGFTYVLANDLTAASIEKAMRKGEMFAASHCIGNYDELVSIAAALKTFYGETELYGNVNAVVQKMTKKIADIDNGVEDADEDIGITYDVLDNDGYCAAATQPMITSVVVDDAADTIQINTENALLVRWISNGKLLATQKAGDATFTLANFSNQLGNYVRAEVFGEGGVVYTQAFLLNAAQHKGTAKVVDSGFFDLGIFDFLIPEFGKFGDILVRFFNNLSK